MTFLSQLYYWTNKVLKKVDLFPTTNFIRYNSDHEYTTATGGFASIAVITIFVVLFASMGLKTIDRSIIQSTTQISNDQQPPFMSFKTNLEGMMFAITVFGFDITTTTSRLFNITLWQNFYGPGYAILNKTQIPLQPCKPGLNSLDQSLSKNFYKFNMNQSLCPAMNYKLSVGGKPTSDVSSLFSIIVDRCNSDLDPSCVNQTVFAAIEAQVEQFVLVVPVLNVQLNPGSIDYKSYYLQDRNYFFFNSKMGMSSSAYVGQAIINTDVSIMPFEDIQTEYFTVLPNLFTNTPYLMSPTRPYATIVFSKVSTTVTHNRSFNKVDSFFSYVGGLIGTMIGLIFVFNFYNRAAYEISISHKLFRDGQGGSISSNSFNVVYFMLMGIKRVLNFCKCSINWPKTQSYIDCVREARLQLDVAYILRKIMLLEAATEMLLHKENIQTLQLDEKPTITEVKEKRKKYFDDQSQQAQKIEKESLGNVNYVQDIIPSSIKMRPKVMKMGEGLQKVSDFSVLQISPRNKQRRELGSNAVKAFKDSRTIQKVSERVEKRQFEPWKPSEEKVNPRQISNSKLIYADEISYQDQNEKRLYSLAPKYTKRSKK